MGIRTARPGSRSTKILFLFVFPRQSIRPIDFTESLVLKPSGRVCALSETSAVARNYARASFDLEKFARQLCWNAVSRFYSNRHVYINTYMYMQMDSPGSFSAIVRPGHRFRVALCMRHSIVYTVL